MALIHINPLPRSYMKHLVQRNHGYHSQLRHLERLKHAFQWEKNICPADLPMAMGQNMPTKIQKMLPSGKLTVYYEKIQHFSWVNQRTI